jgi:hypothetical protein
MPSAQMMIFKNTPGIIALACNTYNYPSGKKTPWLRLLFLFSPDHYESLSISLSLRTKLLQSNIGNHFVTRRTRFTKKEVCRATISP